MNCRQLNANLKAALYLRPVQRMVGILLILYSFSTLAQEDKSIGERKGSFWFYWGYNRSIYSNSNLHFNGPDYDFTVYNLKATDRPSPLSLDYINPPRMTIPQYNMRLGYFLTERFGISFGMDHMKYVVERNQMTTISGVITPEASERYAGSYLNEPISLDPELLTFEHSDGFNLVSLDFEYLLPIARFGKDRFAVDWNFGAGGIWVVTKTKVKVLGEGLDNDFHVAGYTLAAKTGPRLQWKKWFFATEVKGGYASLPSVLIKNAAPEIGDHNVTYLEFYGVLGYYFKLFGRSSKD